MRFAALAFSVMVVGAAAAIACGEDGGELVGAGETPEAETSSPESSPSTPIVTEPATTPAAAPTSGANDEDEIREVANEGARALSEEDWSDTYDLIAPSLRETCLRGNFMVATSLKAEIAKEFGGEEAWEALKADASDGYEITSIEVTGDTARVVALESEDPLEFVREDGQWWLYDDEPCSTDVFEE